MGCNRDSGCYRIANETYPRLKENIDASIQTINNRLTDDITTLDGLVIPEDYLGVKVKEKLEEITSLFASDIDDLTKTKTNLDTFISEKIKEHKNHYDSWKSVQDLKAKITDTGFKDTPASDTSSNKLFNKLVDYEQ